MNKVVDVEFVAHHGNAVNKGTAKLDCEEGKVYQIHIKDVGFADYEEIVLKDGTTFEVSQNGQTTWLVVDTFEFQRYLDEQEQEV